MKYEVIERGAEWIVQNDGLEEARFGLQEDALNHVAARLREADPNDGAVSLSVRYASREAEPQARISK